MSDQLIRDLRAKIDEQAEEILQLKSLLTTNQPLPANMPYLTPKEEEIVRMMLGKDWVRQEAIKASVIPRYIDDADNYLKVYICKIRRKIAAAGFCIENRKGVSYRMIALDEPTKSPA